MIKTLDVTWLAPDDWHELPRWRLNESITYKEYKVPVGFESDGASIPIGFRNSFSPQGRHFPAAFIHDYLLTQDMPRAEADGVFREAMDDLGVSAFRKTVMFSAVRLQTGFLNLKNKLFGK